MSQHDGYLRPLAETLTREFLAANDLYDLLSAILKTHCGDSDKGLENGVELPFSAEWDIYLGKYPVPYKLTNRYGCDLENPVSIRLFPHSDYQEQISDRKRLLAMDQYVPEVCVAREGAVMLGPAPISDSSELMGSPLDADQISALQHDIEAAYVTYNATKTETSNSPLPVSEP